jgi:SH3-like domain-containing protein
MKKKITICLLLVSILFTQILTAEEKFLSLKKSKVNVRYGPGKDHAIKYIYRKINLPIKQIDKKENWRRIVDLKNNSGWIHLSQLKPSNSFIILKNKILFKKPSNFSKPIAKLEKGRLLIIRKCKVSWCNVKTKDLTGDFSGWVKTDNIWGNIK